MGLFFPFLLAFSMSVGARTLYTLADLEILANEGSVDEFFQHALDIRPSERQDAWKAMVVKMGDALSRRLLDKAEVTKNDFDLMEKLYELPALKTDDIFRTRRHALGLRYLKSCLKNEENCWSQVQSFWEKDQTEPETAYQLAELTLAYKDSPVSTWTYLDIALKSPLSEFYCKKPFVLNAIWGKLEMDYVKLGPEGDLLKKIDQTVHPDCLPSLISETSKRLYSPPKVTDRELAFQILKASGKATEEISDFFYSVYLLDNPAQGELFNYSWNRVRELGGTMVRRERVLTALKKLDPLPDAIFTTLDQTKKRVVLKHFSTYFPEYVDYYADQCILYYGGKGSFPNGNPAVNCSEFMASEIAPSVIDQVRMKKFQEARKI